MSSKLETFILEFTAKGGKPVWKNPDDLYRHCVEHEGEDITVQMLPTVKTAKKLKMFRFYYVNVLHCAVIGYTHAGYPAMDTVKADYLLRAECAKSFIEKPNGEFEPIMLDKRSMTNARLLKYLQDCIHFIESELGVRVPSAEEYRMQRDTGISFREVR